MPLALMAMVPTTKVPGSSTPGDHTSTSSQWKELLAIVGSNFDMGAPMAGKMGEIHV